jgi:hypothetical protein
MCSSIFGGKTTKGLLSTMRWSGPLVLVLDHDSPRRCCLWNEVTPTEEVSILSAAYIVRVYYISCIFNFTAGKRYEASASILLKKFLAKILH